MTNVYLGVITTDCDLAVLIVSQLRSIQAICACTFGPLLGNKKIMFKHSILIIILIVYRDISHHKLVQYGSLS